MKNNGNIKVGEFRGSVLTSLEYIKNDITIIKEELETKACKEDVAAVRKQINNIKLTSAIVGGIGGVLTAFGAYLGLRKA